MNELLELPDIEASAAETFRGSSMDWIADDEMSPASIYGPLQAAGLVWVAEADGRLVGFGACEAFDDGLHLWELAVRRDAQGQAIGRRIVEAVVAEASRRAMPAITLTTFRDIPWNAPYYERQGFRVLAAEDLNPRLTEILAEEAARGLTERCAMRLDL